MQEKKIKKYGFFMCFCMVVGTVIGTGVFFRNESIYGLTNGNGILGLISWITGGIIALSFGLSFVEISSTNQYSNSGISLYAKIFGGRKFGCVVRNAMNNIYIPLTTFTIAYYTTKASIWTFGGGLIAENIFSKKVGGNINYELILIIFSIIYTVLLIYICTYFEKVGKYIQIITVFLKLIPLILIGIIGMFFFSNNVNAFSNSGLGDNKYYKLVINKSYFEMILMTLPGVLFSFDGFLSTTYIQKDVKKPGNNIPLALTIGMIFIIFLYLFVSIGTLNLDARGNIAVAIGKIFNNVIFNKIFERVIFIFILITTFGVLNGYSFSLVKLSYSSIEENFMIGTKFWNKIIKKYNINLANFLASFILILVWGIIIGVLTIFTKGMYNFCSFVSNAGVIMAFLMYGIIILLGVLNRYYRWIKTVKSWYFFPSAIISIFCIFIIIGYNIYSYFLNIIFSENKTGAIFEIVLLLLILVIPWLGLWMKDNQLINKKKPLIKESNKKNNNCNYNYKSKKNLEIKKES